MTNGQHRGEPAHTARLLVAGDRGVLAMDESMSTCNRRFAALGIPQTQAMRQAWRDLIVTTPRLGECINGAILSDETIRQTTLAGVPFAQALQSVGIVPGIKVDAGAKDLAGFDGEQVTEGLDGLRQRLAEYAAMGVRFAKWRAVIAIGEARPSRGCIDANAHALARYAALCQQAGIVPIVEPEVLADGSHTLARCAAVIEEVLHAVFDALRAQRVRLDGLLLKPNMVLPGAASADANSADAGAVDAVAEATVAAFLRAVPAVVPGIVFLSGGQPAALASARLNAMNRGHRARAPWPLSFSFARAIQQPALECWLGLAANVPAARRALFHRADCNRAARRGGYDAATDQPAADATNAH
jgi:fructose-bisphosphate aldolase, class I